MRTLLALMMKGGPDHRAVFHAFAIGLAAMLRHRRMSARARVIDL